jgi:hypothetical protein
VKYEWQLLYKVTIIVIAGALKTVPEISLLPSLDRRLSGRMMKLFRIFLLVERRQPQVPEIKPQPEGRGSLFRYKCNLRVDKAFMLRYIKEQIRMVGNMLEHI